MATNNANVGGVSGVGSAGGVGNTLGTGTLYDLMTEWRRDQRYLAAEAGDELNRVLMSDGYVDDDESEETGTGTDDVYNSDLDTDEESADEYSEGSGINESDDPDDRPPIDRDDPLEK